MLTEVKKPRKPREPKEVKTSKKQPKPELDVHVPKQVRKRDFQKMHSAELRKVIETNTNLINTIFIDFEKIRKSYIVDGPIHSKTLEKYVSIALDGLQIDSAASLKVHKTNITTLLYGLADKSKDFVIGEIYKTAKDISAILKIPQEKRKVSTNQYDTEYKYNKKSMYLIFTVWFLEHMVELDGK